MAISTADSSDRLVNEGRLKMREDVRAVLRSGPNAGTSIFVADLVREVVEWSQDNPEASSQVLDWVNN